MWKTMIKTKDPHILRIAMQIICMEGQCQKLLVGDFILAWNTSKFNKDFNQESDYQQIIKKVM